MLDGGDALFRRLSSGDDSPPTEAETARARAILQAMGAMGTDVMAIGSRDVAGGLELLREGAREAGIALVSANLLDAKGQRVFDASTVLVKGGLKIGVVGISTADLKVAEARANLRAGLTAAEPGVAARAAIAALEGKVDLILLLGRLTVREQRAILPQLDLPLAFVGTSGQLSPGGSRLGRALAYDGGFRGQALQRVDLSVQAPGLFRDPKEREVSALPPGLQTPNEAKASGVFLNLIGPKVAKIDDALEAVRLPEEKKLRASRARKAPEGDPPTPPAPSAKRPNSALR